MSSKNAANDTVLDLLMIVYGSSKDDPLDDSRFCGHDQRRVEVQLAPVMPPEVAASMRRRQEWAHELSGRVTPDLKHGQRWHCEFCDKLARESFVQNVSWLHLSPPRLIIYVHLMCDTQQGPCAARLREVAGIMASQTGQPNLVMTMPNRFAPDPVFPAAASCLNCKGEETIRKSLSQCGACKLVRYCSTACQREDWGRHKKTCKAVKDVKWIWK
ncbi:uncharacterized protein PHACADRAFT_206078 [Phanerochaete carnosa HHB-10118-sp]|uniref:MYND-type domain-containing protein n=1 Tax=Phanerochaete carnosa (strain HHB-10118-sp) TaxID=650164 RepID=K5WL32_PHACS|nr:uncharacterized protein PHACADRAFT_206078 [Phanerochaete carnosa HHB-10118-sp]EKM59859.1 hypothetical protein PHACADRAFT_206078 [Phanerochaete carnosa HHB-10118-sp]